MVFCFFYRTVVSWGFVFSTGGQTQHFAYGQGVFYHCITPSPDFLKWDLSEMVSVAQADLSPTLCFHFFISLNPRSPGILQLSPLSFVILETPEHRIGQESVLPGAPESMKMETMQRAEHAPSQ